MALSTQAIRYGWVALVGITITGTSIYVLNNTRRQVQQIDLIELMLGAHERCLATQNGTNPATYAVDPPSIVRNFVTNSYTSSVLVVTNSGVIVTGINYYIVGSTQEMTNCIGWYSDRDMLVTLDATIQSLCPYYINTSTFAALTFTGLLVELGIGNGTNFTRVPCWTNNWVTNYYISYTNWWPTNGTFPTTNSYTTTLYTAVNYAESWTSTGGCVWVSRSNWPSVVTRVTNAATYGVIPWQVYEQDLVERYKVLNALSTSPRFLPDSCDIKETFGVIDGDHLGWYGGYDLDFEVSKTESETIFTTSPVFYDYTNVSYNNHWPEFAVGSLRSYSIASYQGGWTNYPIWSSLNSSKVIFGVKNYSGVSVPASCNVYIEARTNILIGAGGGVPTNTWDGQGSGIANPGTNIVLLETIPATTNSIIKSATEWGAGTMPVWCDAPQQSKGFLYYAYATKVFQFNYCTNKFW